MKNYILPFLLGILLLSSCTSEYRGFKRQLCDDLLWQRSNVAVNGRTEIVKSTDSMIIKTECN